MTKKIKAAEDELKMLKAEICELKVTVKIKETQLEETMSEQTQSLIDLKEENNQLKDIIDNFKNAKDDADKMLNQLDRENKDLKKQNIDQDSRFKGLHLKFMHSDSKLNAQIAIIKIKNNEIQKQNDTIKEKSEEISKLKADLNCDKCDFISENLSSLVKHVALKHQPGKEMLSCKNCDFTCRKLFDLQVHTSTQHPIKLSEFKGFTAIKPQKKMTHSFEFK